METHIYTTPTSVICINEETGKVIWQLTTKQITALREAGEKMEERLRMLKTYQNFCRTFPDSLNIEKIFTDDDEAALAEWEAANK